MPTLLKERQESLPDLGSLHRGWSLGAALAGRQEDSAGPCKLRPGTLAMYLASKVAGTSVYFMPNLIIDMELLSPKGVH